MGFQADFLDEDWGWLVFSVRGNHPIFEIAIYNLAYHGEGGRPGMGHWGLLIRSFERRRFLGLFHRTREIPVPAAITQAIDGALREIGCIPEPWQGAQSGRPT